MTLSRMADSLFSLPAPETPPDGSTSSGGGRGSRRLWDDETWATPRTASQATSEKNLREFRDGGNTSKAGLEQQATRSISLKETAKRLNPLFVAWLMNWPPQWAVASMPCEPAETGWSRSRQRRLLSDLLGERG